MDDIWILVLLSVAMFVGCYVAGSIPLALTLSEVLFAPSRFNHDLGEGVTISCVYACMCVCASLVVQNQPIAIKNDDIMTNYFLYTSRI